MDIWIVAAAIGLVGLAYSLWRFALRPSGGRRPRRASLFVGALIPVVFAAQFSSLLFDLFPGLTIVDVAALFAVGMVSGFFLGVGAVQAGMENQKRVES
ncbi:MAG: hypothetical protein GWM87_07550 [Xanthomonadales bacterium]|nr:hypothetical protein [Xanthomonadales bacterium]NIX12802.1 hypothetical protein [Xanthomonadales bacterium]